MINPYEPSNPSAEVIPNSASPLLDELRVEAVPQDPQPAEKRPSLPRTFGKWLLICSVSAAPSFILGSLASNSQYLGMLTGIALFIVGYTWLDRYTWKFTWRKNPVIRRILRIMYTTRVAISASLIGTPLDMDCGMLALGATAFLFQDFAASNSNSFTSALIATIIQGTILNAVLLLYGLLLFTGYAVYKNWSEK